MNKNPIGVFDSGIGGLTVLQSLIDRFPNEDFLYVADSKNVPYGTKSDEEIKSLVDKMYNNLILLGAKAIVIACNTATTQAEHLFYGKTPVIGVIKPTAEEAAKGSNKVVILATNATIKSGVYQKYLRGKDKEIFPVTASVFVDAIEAGEIGTDYSYNLVTNHLRHLQHRGIDTVILGCTHFGLFRKEIQNVFHYARLIESGPATASALHRILLDEKLLNDQKKGKVHLFTTGDVGKFKEQIKIFNLKYDTIEKLSI